MNNRRKLLVALGAVGVWGPLKSVAQQTGSMPTVGILSLEVEDQIAMFREGLRKLGYVEGRNIRRLLTWRFLDLSHKLCAIAVLKNRLKKAQVVQRL